MFLEVQWNPPPAALRRWSFITAGVMGCVAALMGAIWPGSQRPVAAAVLAGVLVAAGLIGPVASRPLHRAWMTLAWGVATAVGTVALALVYFLVITPIGLACRVAGRDLLQWRRTSARSLWMPVDPRADDPRRQF